MFDECYQAVGDLAETIALLLPDAEKTTDLPLHYWVEERLLPLARWNDDLRRDSLVNAWREMDEPQRFVWNKLITGAFRVGVSQSLVVRALAQVSGIAAPVISHRLMGDWHPSPEFYAQLIAKRSRRCGCEPALSVLPRLSDRRRDRAAGRHRGVADRMEMGWHPIAADPAELADVHLVARRGTGDGALSRNWRLWVRCCPRAR